MIQYYPIRLLKMVTGEMVISGISDAGANNYVLERPMTVVIVPIKRGGPEGNRRVQPGDSVEGVSVVMKDWIDFCSDDYITVAKTSVVCITTPMRELLADYQMAKINADMDKEMGFAPDVLTDPPEGDDEDDGEYGEGEDPEFPGWGGNPKLGE